MVIIQLCWHAPLHLVLCCLTEPQRPAGLGREHCRPSSHPPDPLHPLEHSALDLMPSLPWARLWELHVSPVLSNPREPKGKKKNSPGKTKKNPKTKIGHFHYNLKPTKPQLQGHPYFPQSFPLCWPVHLIVTIRPAFPMTGKHVSSLG